MKKNKPKYLFYVLFCLVLNLQAQDFVVIDTISFKGNTISKEKIIFRSLDIQIGDTVLVVDLNDKLEANGKLLFSTGMFDEVKHNISSWEEQRVEVVFTVVENRLFLPIPSLDLADRNFNVWWKDYNFSLKRINFELGLSHANLTGYNDQLNLLFQVGFTRKIEIKYVRPYLGESKNWGYGVGVFYTSNKEINYDTELNKLKFYRDEEDVLLRRYRAHSALLYRHKTSGRHKLQLTYFKNQVDPKILAEYNPQYFKDGQLVQQYFNLHYTYIYSTKDVVFYPKKGFFVKGEINKEGLGIFDDRNFLNTSLTLEKYNSFGERFSSKIRLKLHRELNPKFEDYYNYKSLGYGSDDLRGYEVYVTNGLHYYYNQMTLRYTIFKKVHDWKRFMPIKSFRIMPIELDLIIFGDIGYVEDPYLSINNDFTNRFLFGKGAGIDMLLFGKYLFQIQYSFNHKNEHGLFLHYKFNFE